MMTQDFATRHSYLPILRFSFRRATDCRLHNTMNDFVMTANNQVKLG